MLFWLAVLSLAGAPLADAGAAMRPAAVSAAAPDHAQDLPADPLAAVEALVEQVYGPDEAQAVRLCASCCALPESRWSASTGR